MWTPSALASEVCQKAGTAWRVVEDQHVVSTRKLVDTRSDQELLEDILEDSKPPVPQGAEHLHYLLKTPFRYDAPYPFGSRFRRAGSTEGVFYASEAIRTALAEFCNYRLRFFQESPDVLWPRQEERLTVFTIAYRSTRTIDLTRPPFVKDRDTWTHPSAYQVTQAFADTAREAHIEILRYESVRDTEGGTNIVLLSPLAFSALMPTMQQTWFLYLSEVEANCTRAHSNSDDESWTFKREQFEL